MAYGGTSFRIFLVGRGLILRLRVRAVRRLSSSRRGRGRRNGDLFAEGLSAQDNTRNRETVFLEVRNFDELAGRADSRGATVPKRNSQLVSARLFNGNGHIIDQAVALGPLVQCLGQLQSIGPADLVHRYA